MMNNYSGQKDARVQKTHRALTEALLSLLRLRNFNDITVNNLCSEALTSRSAFYSHFNDKYDLLSYFLTSVRKSIIKDVHNYDELEMEVNQFIHANQKTIANILHNANSETLTIIRDFMSAIVDLAIKRKISNMKNPNRIILFNIIIGGLVNHLRWITENGFPPEVRMMSPYLYKMIEFVTEWDAGQEEFESDAYKDRPMR